MWELVPVNQILLKYGSSMLSLYDSEIEICVACFSMLRVHILIIACVYRSMLQLLYTFYCDDLMFIPNMFLRCCLWYVPCVVFSHFGFCEFLEHMSTCCTSILLVR
jgi:hypothetical protein